MFSSAPIISPYDLIQEHYHPDAWKIMICCMLLNQTTRKQVDLVVDKFFKKYPTSMIARNADPEEMAEILKSLGFKNRRAKAIIRMSDEWNTKDWLNPIEIYGLGQYAQDCYDMFVNRMIVKNPSDHALKNYAVWLESSVLEEVSLDI